MKNNVNNKLIYIYPEIAAELHLTLNNEIDINDIDVSCNKRVFWMCHNGHTYEMRINERTGKYKQGCYYCSNRKVLKGFNDLASKYPKIAAEWDYNNNDKKPEDVVYGSTYRAYWICTECGNRWLTPVRNRTKRNSSCPVCAIKKNGINRHENAILTSGGIQNKLLLEEWDYEKNITRPSDHTEGCAASVYWKCSKCGYNYKSKINNRAKLGRGCPLCTNKVVVKGVNDLVTTHPKIAAEWDYEKNAKKPFEVSYGCGKKVWWKCSQGHSYQATVNHRTSQNGTNCPICNQGRQTSFAEQAVYFYVKKIYPDAINRYKDIFKKTMELDIYIPSIKLGIEYDGEAWHKEDKYLNEVKKYEICKENDIKLIRLKEKYSEKDSLTADTTLHVEKMYEKKNLYKAITYLISMINLETNMWTRKKFDTWYSSLDISIEKDENEIRANMISIQKNSLEDIYPDIALEWNYEKNGKLKPNMFKPKSDAKVWWVCQICGYEYESSINHRTSGTGCPKCGIIKSAQAKSKKVNMIDIKTNEILKTFVSISEASRVMNITSGNICAVLAGKRKHTKGYGWKYVQEK